MRPEKLLYGTKYGGTIYLSEHRHRVEALAESFGKNFMGTPSAHVEVADPATVEILKRDGYRIVNLDEQED